MKSNFNLNGGEQQKMATTILLVEQKIQATLEFGDRGYVTQAGRVDESGQSRTLLQSKNVRNVYVRM